MDLPAVSDQKHPGRQESDTWDSEVGDKKDLRPLTPQLKKRSWQFMKEFDLFQKWLVLKNSSSCYPDWQCWAGCSKVKSLPHIMLQMPHGARGSLWLHSNLGLDFPVTQVSLRSTWVVLKVKIPGHEKRKRRRWSAEEASPCNYLHENKKQ